MQKLRALREQRALSTRQLAAQLGISSSGYISKLETGKQTPSLALLLKISLFFNVSTDQLLGDDLEVERALWDFVWAAHRSPELVRVLRAAPPTSWGVQPLTTRNPRDPLKVKMGQCSDLGKKCASCANNAG